MAQLDPFLETPLMCAAGVYLYAYRMCTVCLPVRLYKLLGEAVIESFQHVGAHA